MSAFDPNVAKASNARLMEGLKVLLQLGRVSMHVDADVSSVTVSVDTLTTVGVVDYIHAGHRIEVALEKAIRKHTTFYDK